jgi:hypothetical protein
MAYVAWAGDGVAFDVEQGVECLVDGAATQPCQTDQYTPAIGPIGTTLDQARLLEPVEALGHPTGRDHHSALDVAGVQAGATRAAAQRCQHRRSRRRSG